jgi:Flp pilus assembly protein TadD
MTSGAELRRAREALSATLADVAEYAGMSERELAQVEALASVPRNVADRIEFALWALRGRQVLAERGLPECGWMTEFDRVGADADPDRYLAHMRSCELCITRDIHVRKTIGPAPGTGGGWFGRFIDFGMTRPPLQRGVIFGAGVMLMLGGVGVPILLGMAVVHRDLSYVAAAIGLFVLLVTSGAAAGIVHHLTAPLRAGGGATGHYTSWVLTVAGYVLTVLWILTVADVVAPGRFGDDLPTLSGPADLIIALGMSAFFGVVVGWMMRGGHSGVPRRRVSPVLHPLSILGFTAMMIIVGRLVVAVSDRVAPATWEDVLPALIAAVEAEPTDSAAQRELAHAYVHLAQWDQALPALERAITLNPEDPSLRYDLGWVLSQRQEYEHAIEPLRLAIRGLPDHPSAHHALGWALANLGRFPEAEHSYREALRLGVDTGGAHDELGWVLLELDRLEEAEASFRRAIRTEPDVSWFHRGLGIALMRQGRPADALAAFQAAVDLDPDEPRFWADIGHLAHITGDHGRAIDAFETAARLYPAVFDDDPQRRAMWEASRSGAMHP